MARSSGKSSGESDKPNNYPANRRSGRSGGSAGASSGGKSGGTGLLLAVALPALAIAGTVAYFGNPQFRSSVDDGTQQIQAMMQSHESNDAVSLGEESAFAELQPNPADDDANLTCARPFRTEADAARSAALQADVPADPQVELVAPTPIPPKPETAAQVENPAPKQSKQAKAKTNNLLAKPSKAVKPEVPKTKQVTQLKEPPKPVQEMDLPVRAGGLTLRQSQDLVAMVFGGEVVRSKVSKGRDWYEMTWNGGQKAAPFDVAPKSVTVSARALTGLFAQKHPGFIVFMNVSDPQGPEWTHTYLGAVLVAGTPDNPGRILGTTAMQAPRGRFTRREARDLDGDGTAELVLEIESQAPGGYVNRDLAIHKFGRSGTKILFSSRTLEDGPGVPTAEAKFKEITFQDTNKDGLDEIVVKEGVRSFDVDETLYRTQTGQKIHSTRTFRLNKGRYRVANK